MFICFSFEVVNKQIILSTLRRNKDAESVEDCVYGKVCIDDRRKHIAAQQSSVCKANCEVVYHTAAWLARWKEYTD